MSREYYLFRVFIFSFILSLLLCRYFWFFQRKKEVLGRIRTYFLSSQLFVVYVMDSKSGCQLPIRSSSCSKNITFSLANELRLISFWLWVEQWLRSFLSLTWNLGRKKRDILVLVSCSSFTDSHLIRESFNSLLFNHTSGSHHT